MIASKFITRQFEVIGREKGKYDAPYFRIVHDYIYVCGAYTDARHEIMKRFKLTIEPYLELGFDVKIVEHSFMIDVYSMRDEGYSWDRCVSIEKYFKTKYKYIPEYNRSYSNFSQITI